MNIAKGCLILLLLSGCSTLQGRQYKDEDFELLQAQKDRSEVPAAVQDVTVAQVVGWAGDRAMPEPGVPREGWRASERAYVYHEEQHAIRVECYLLEAKAQPDGDYHLYVAAAPDSTKRSGFIAEMTPYFLKQGKWPIGQVKKYEGQKVRVTGWLLWDDQHDSGGDRGTSWEIHPVTQFEVQDSVTWHPI